MASGTLLLHLNQIFFFFFDEVPGKKVYSSFLLYIVAAIVL